MEALEKGIQKISFRKNELKQEFSGLKVKVGNIKFAGHKPR